MGNQKGHRDMTLGEVDNSSKFGTTNIGQSDIDNQGGSANISLKKSVNSGDHSMVIIGLLELKGKAHGQPAHAKIHVKTLNDFAMNGKTEVATGGPGKGKTQSVSIDKINEGGQGGHTVIGNKSGNGHQKINIGGIQANGQNESLDIFLI